MSGWTDAILCRDKKPSTIIKNLPDIVATFGIPYTSVTDNAPEFTSYEMPPLVTSLGCQRLHSPEYRPQPNQMVKQREWSERSRMV